MSQLPVYFETRRVGTIEVDADGPSFVYDPQWLSLRGAFPLSLLMPLSPFPVRPQLFLPWAANLLPEGQQLRTMGSIFGAAPEDVISILTQIGRDTAGALSVGKPGTSGAGHRKSIDSEVDLERIIEELRTKPFLAGEDGVSMSLAGVQSKLGVAVEADGRLCIPVDGAPSTHILKPDSDRLWGGVQNEALCLVLARRCGLAAPGVTTGRAGKRRYLLITRYDRVEQGNRWRRLHQEDFCQAFGKPPSAKYESNQTGIAGPTLAQMFHLTRHAMAAPDLLHLLDYAIFNIIVCNTDAHAKNYSMLISGQGFRLAPIYDVMCAAAWDNVTRNMAQKIAGKTRGEHLKRRHWETFARDCGLNAPRVVGRVESLAALAQKELPAAVAEVEAMPAGSHALMPKFREAITARARALVSGLTLPDDSFLAAGDTDRDRAVPVKEPSAPRKPKKPRARTKAPKPA